MSKALIFGDYGGNTHREGYKLYSTRAIAGDIKELVCRVPDTPFQEAAYANVPMTLYELPDGQTIEIGADRFKIPDVLFNSYLSQVIPFMSRKHSPPSAWN